MVYKFCVKHDPEIVKIKKLIYNREICTFISFNCIENVWIDTGQKGCCVSENFVWGSSVKRVKYITTYYESALKTIPRKPLLETTCCVSQEFYFTILNNINVNNWHLFIKR